MEYLRNRKHALRVSIELYKHQWKFISFRKHREEKKENNFLINFDYQNVNYLPSLRQQRAKVLCLIELYKHDF